VGPTAGKLIPDDPPSAAVALGDGPRVLRLSSQRPAALLAPGGRLDTGDRSMTFDHGRRVDRISGGLEPDALRNDYRLRNQVCSLRTTWPISMGPTGTWLADSKPAIAIASLVVTAGLILLARVAFPLVNGVMGLSGFMILFLFAAMFFLLLLTTRLPVRWLGLWRWRPRHGGGFRGGMSWQGCGRHDPPISMDSNANHLQQHLF
jgi:hypothetical protein